MGQERQTVDRRNVGLTVLLGLVSCLGFGCSTPVEIKTAAQMQMEAIREAQLAEDDYSRAVDRLVAEAAAITSEAQAARSASTAVKEVIEDLEAAGGRVDLVKASDDVALKIRQELRTPQQDVQALQGLAQRHAQNLGFFSLYLDLLYRSQQLIVDFLLTDLGPTQDQLSELKASILNLNNQVSGGTP